MAPTYPSFLLPRGSFLFVIVCLIYLIVIRGVDSRPSPSSLPHDGQITKNSDSLFAEQDESSDNLQSSDGDDILQEIIDDVLEYRQYHERAEMIKSARVQDKLDIPYYQDSDEMMGDMPVQDEEDDDIPSGSASSVPMDNISRRLNFFPSVNSGAEGMDQGGAIRQIIVRAPNRLNNSDDRESFLDELANMSLSSLNASSMQQGSNTSSMTSTGVDASSYTSMQKSARESQEFAFVERNRELRLKTIKEQILSFLGMMGRPQVENSTVPRKQVEIIAEMYNRMKNQTWPPADIYTEKVQSFYPSCDVPKNTDEDLWHDSHAMNLLFDLSTPMVSNGTTVNVIAAKLRLYKLSQTNTSAAPAALCSPVVAGEEDPLQLTPTDTAALEDDQKIRVSVYWYTRSLKKNKLKRKLLDSKMLSVHGDEWTEFSVKQAAIEWRNKLKPNRNFGLVVEVENEDNVILPAAQYLSAMNCSKEASTARPIPGFLVDAARFYIMGNTNRTNVTHSSRNSSLDFNNSVNYHSYLFPMIDLCTNEVPVHEAENAALYIHAQHMAQHSVQPEEHYWNPVSATKNTSDSDMFQQYQSPPSSEPAADLTDEEDISRLRHQHHAHSHQALSEATMTAYRNNNPITVQLHNSRAVRHPRRPLETAPHRRRHHHGESVTPAQHNLDDSDQGTWPDTNGFQLRKQIIQKVILTQQRNTTETVNTDNR